MSFCRCHCHTPEEIGEMAECDARARRSTNPPRAGTFADTSRPKYSTINVEVVIHGAKDSAKTLYPRSSDGLGAGRFRVSDGMLLTIDLDLDVTEPR